MVFGPDQFEVCVGLPCIGDASGKIGGCLSSCLSGIGCGSVELGFANSFTRLGDVFGFGDGRPAHLKSGVVCLVTCSCGRGCVGGACRGVGVRFGGRVGTGGTGLTGVGGHLLDSPSCGVGFEDCGVLGCESCACRGGLGESLFIRQLDGGGLLDDKLTSVPLFIFNLPSLSDRSGGGMCPGF